MVIAPVSSASEGGARPVVIRATKRRASWAAVAHVARDLSFLARGASSAEALAEVLPRVLAYLDRTGSPVVPTIEVAEG